MHADEAGVAASSRPSAVEIAIVLVLMLVAGTLRFRGIDFLLPVQPLSDSYDIVQQIDKLRDESWGRNFQIDLAAYPRLIARTTVLLPEPPDVPPTASPTLEDHLRLAREPWLQIRLVATSLSLLIIPGVWLLARRFLSRGAALLAAALVATSLLHVVFAVQEKPHGPLSALLPFAVLAGILLRRRGDVASYLFAGVMIGLPIAMLHSGAAALLVLPVAILLRERRPGRASAWWSLAAIAIVALLVYSSYPALFRRGTEQLQVTESDGEGVLEIPGSNQIFLRLLNGRGFVVIVEGLWSNDPLLLLGIVLGLVALVASLARTRGGDPARRKDLVVVLAFVLPYLGAIGIFENTQERYLLPLLPFFACFAAFGFERAYRAAFPVRRHGPGETRAREIAPALAAAILPALATIPAWGLGNARIAPDTYDQAARFLETNAAPETDRIVVLSALDLPLLHAAAALDVNARFPARSNWVRYQTRLQTSQFANPRYAILLVPGETQAIGAALRGAPIPYLRDQRASFALIPVAPYFDAAREPLRRDADRVFRTSPDDELPEGEFEIVTYMHGRNEEPWTKPLFLTALSSERLGQTLEIYRLR